MSTELLNLANLSREQIENRLIEIAGAADADPVLRAEKQFLEKALGVLSAHDFLQHAIVERDAAEEAKKRKAFEETILKAFWADPEPSFAICSAAAADVLKEAGGEFEVMVYLNDNTAIDVVRLQCGEAVVSAQYPTRPATADEIAAQKQREKNGGGVVVAEVQQ